MWCIFVKFFCLCNDLLHPVTGKVMWPIDSNKPHLSGKAGLGGKKNARNAFARVHSHRAVSQGVCFVLLNLE